MSGIETTLAKKNLIFRNWTFSRWQKCLNAFDWVFRADFTDIWNIIHEWVFFEFSILKLKSEWALGPKISETLL